MSQTLVLASQSPRRKELLAQLGYQFTTCAADIDESVQANELAEPYVRRLAEQKAQTVFLLLNKAASAPSAIATSATNHLVLGSDTSVVYQGEILGKPVDFADCQRMLNMLSGNVHQVYTAIAVANRDGVVSQVVVTDVYFKTLSAREIENYWQTGEPQDKAGSYGIQGIAGQFIEKIAGSYSSVVGLPLFETSELLAQHGMMSAMQIE